MHKTETLAEYGGTLFSENEDKSIIVVEVENERTGGIEHEVWVQNDGFAGFTLTHDGHQYEFASSYIAHRAVKRLIDSVWTAVFRETKDGEATVLKYSRNDAVGIKRERELPLLDTEETANRQLVAIYVQPRASADRTANWADTKSDNTIRYKVENPKGIFSYGA